MIVMVAVEWTNRTVFLVCRFSCDSTRAFFYFTTIRSREPRKSSGERGDFSWMEISHVYSFHLWYAKYSLSGLEFSFTHNNGAINTRTWNLHDFNWFCRQSLLQPLWDFVKMSFEFGDICEYICWPGWLVASRLQLFPSVMWQSITRQIRGTRKKTHERIQPHLSYAFR